MEAGAANRWVESLGGDFRAAEMSPRERAILEYAEKLTVAPGDVRAADVEALRAAGLDDLAIHDLCAVVAYFAFVNRIADGLGVELEERWPAGLRARDAGR